MWLKPGSDEQLSRPHLEIRYVDVINGGLLDSMPTMPTTILMFPSRYAMASISCCWSHGARLFVDLTQPSAPAKNAAQLRSDIVSPNSL